MESTRPALTILSEEEQSFRQAVREFAEGEIKPRVTEMDEKAQMDPEVLKQLFQIYYQFLSICQCKLHLDPLCELLSVG